MGGHAERREGGQLHLCGRDLPQGPRQCGRECRQGIWEILAAHLGLTYFFYVNGSRSEEVILKELGGDSGTIQSDGLKAYKKVEAFRNLLPDKWTKKEQSK